MAERPDQSNDVPSEEQAPIGMEPTQDEPRREASARFVVEGGGSSTAELRDAMDPANQSLADALRLSYRVLQLGILALVITFLFSGFQSVREGATGVKTIFGAIVGDEAGAEQLSPGLHPFWPYPIGELVVFDQKSTVAVMNQFQPFQKENLKTKEQEIAAADSARALTAGRDGFILTADGDIAHLSLSATYTVQDAVEFLERTTPDQAKAIVEKALMRAAVLMGGQFTLREFIDQRDAPAIALRDAAQEAIKDLHIGIVLGEVTIADRSPPRFVESRFQEVQEKRTVAKAVVEIANQEVARILNGVADDTTRTELMGLIRNYDAALVKGDQAEADRIFTTIGARLEREDMGGQVSSTIQQARAAASRNEATLNRELSRLRGLAPAFAANPRQLVRQLWLEAVAAVMAGPEIEIVAAPNEFGLYDLTVKSSQDVMQKRRDAAYRRAQQAAQEKEFGLPVHVFRGDQISPEGNFNRLERDGTKGRGRSDIRKDTSGQLPPG